MSYNSKRTGAEVETLLNKAETALQSVPSEYVTEGVLNEGLKGKVDKVGGKQLTTEDFTTALKTKLDGLNNYDDTEIENAITSLQTQFNTLVSGNASDAINSFNEIIAFLDGIQDTQDLSSIIASIEQQIAGKMDKVTLAKVATSGSYNDLSNKPTIPTQVTESTVSGWGFTKNSGTYSKPSDGIPKTDLAGDVQASLDKAESALQSYTEQYKGTITEVKMNGKSKGTSGVVDLGTVITAVPTIDEERVLSSTTISTFNANTVFTYTTTLSSLTISSFGEPEPETRAAFYTIVFKATSCTLTVPSTVIWSNGQFIEFDSSGTHTYEINFMKVKIADGVRYLATWNKY